MTDEFVITVSSDEEDKPGTSVTFKKAERKNGEKKKANWDFLMVSDHYRNR